MTPKDVIQFALKVASRLNDLVNTYDYNAGPPPAAIAPELKRLKRVLVGLWRKLSKEEMAEYQRQYAVLPNSPRTPSS